LAVGDSVSAPRQEAFAAALQAEYDYLLRSLRRVGVAERDTEDLAQDVLVAAYIKWDTFDASKPLRPWLFAFVVRRAANYRRKATESLEDAETAAEASDFGERDLVLRALLRLPFDQRVAFLMHDLDGWSVPEIANTVGAPENTVYSRIRLAREAFRRSVMALKSEEEST
jgi:RNA polymerase sigma-70 factor (ECF subfamily)